MIKVGLVGLPNVGKSTTFNWITHGNALVSNRSFATIKPNHKIVEIKLPIVTALKQYFSSKKAVFPIIEVIDIAGLVKGSSCGYGLGNEFLSHIGETDCIIHVVRLFDNENVANDSGETKIINPIEDITVICDELCLHDLFLLEKQIKKAKKQFLQNQNNNQLDSELKCLNKLYELLKLGGLAYLKEFGKANNLHEKSKFSKAEIGFLKKLNFLTVKPGIFLFNISEKDVKNASFLMNKYNLSIFDSYHLSYFFACSSLENEMTLLPENEKKEYLNALNLQKDTNEIFLNFIFHLVGKMIFLTTGEKETRAWICNIGDDAKNASAVIHSSFKKNFVRAKVFNAQTFLKSKPASNTIVPWKIENKDYCLQSYDVCEFIIRK